VYILRFPSASAQKAALTRLSLFLEDGTHHGTVLAALPTGRVAGPASYSGHNCRSEDAARFFVTARCGSACRRERVLPVRMRSADAVLLTTFCVPAPRA
jgi:hypothetical protein